MLKRLIAISTLVFIPGSAVAQESEEEKGAEAVTQMSISLEDCKKLLRHKARGDVAYKPGVDVHGKKVTPADLQPLGAITLPDEIVIDFGLDLAGRYGFGSAALFDATAGIATVHYDLASGSLTFNGKPVLKDDARALAKACELRLKPK